MCNFKLSVCVIAYNHELYIAQCLQSIVDQRCSFNFEIIVRDDCSQDRTLLIIKDFQARYPNIIRLIVAAENLGANKNILAVFTAANGKFLALCEGDDYWFDDCKLAKQVAVMESQPELTFSAHPCWLHEANGRTKKAFVKSAENLEITCKDVLNVYGQFAPTASYMFKKELIEYLPTWFGEAPVGDFFIEMYAIVMGRGLYLPAPMSVYRTYSINSWTTFNNEKQNVDFGKFSSAMVSCLLRMKKDVFFSEFDFSKKLAVVYFNICTGALLRKDFIAFKESIINCHACFPGLSTTQSIFYALKDFPFLIYVLYKIKRLIC